jgi:hypothetical protein
MKALIISVTCFILLSCGKNPTNDHVPEPVEDARAYADEHWSLSKYLDWYNYWKYWYEVMGGITPFDWRELPQDKTDEYYKSIAIYDQFVYGWADIYDHIKVPDVAPMQIIEYCPPPCWRNFYPDSSECPHACRYTLYTHWCISDMVSECVGKYKRLLCAEGMLTTNCP